MASGPEFLGDFFEEFKVVLSVGTWNDQFVLIKTVFAFGGLRLLGLFSVRLNLCAWLLVDVVDEAPFLKKLMDADDGAGVSCKSLSGFGGSDILVFAQLDDVVTVFLVEFFVLLEFDVALGWQKGTIVARMPFLILNHSGSAFFSIS